MKFQLKIIAITMFVLILAMTLSSVLSLVSFEKIYTSSLISVYEAAGKNLKRKTEQSLRFGKPLDKFQGMEVLLAEVLEKKKDISYVAVGTPDGDILYHTDPEQIGKTFPYPVPEFAPGQTAITRLDRGMYLTFLPLLKRADEPAGIVLMSFSREVIYKRLSKMAVENVKAVASVTAGASFLLVGLLAFFMRGDLHKNIRLKIFGIAMGMIVAGQLVYSFVNIRTFQESHLETVETTCLNLAEFLKEDMEYVLNFNIPLSRLIKLENTLKEIADVTPELSFIEISDMDRNVLYYADHQSMRRTDPGERKSDASASIVTPVFYQKENRQVGMIGMKISPEMIESKSREILLDMITVILTSLLIAFEVLTFSLKRSTAELQQEKHIIPYSYIRPVIFLFIMADGFCTSFFPMYADMLYQPLWGISREVMTGLPISVYMLSVVFSMLLAGNWSDRTGWYRPLMIGIFANASGLILTAMAQDMLQLLLFRCLTGIGFGIVFIGGQRFVAEYTDSQQRSAGMASFLAAFSAGSICGTVMGGMLADRIGYRNVFFFSGMISLTALLCCLYIFKNESKESEKKTKGAFPFREVFKALKDPEFFSIVFLQAIPAKIILIGCLFYLVPLYLKNLQILQSDIGRVIMTYNMAIVLLGYFFSKYLDKQRHRKYYIFAGGMLTGLSMICFYREYADSGFLATLLLVIAIGISHTFSISSQMAVITETKVIKEIGTGTGMGVFRFWERLGNVAGPLLAGFLIVKLGYAQTFAVLGSMSVICSLLYLVTVFWQKYQKAPAISGELAYGSFPHAAKAEKIPRRKNQTEKRRRSRRKPNRHVSEAAYGRSGKKQK
ncbi:MAG: MFS transporter [Desulfobacterales bacterium]